MGALPLYLLLFLLLEIFVASQVAELIGGLGVFALLVLGFFVGSSIMKRQRYISMQGFTAGSAASLNPASFIFSFLAAVLFIFPGFISDIFGVLLMLPYTQHHVSKSFVKSFVGGSGANAGFGRSMNWVYGNSMQNWDLSGYGADANTFDVTLDSTEPNTKTDTNAGASAAATAANRAAGATGTAGTTAGRYGNFQYIHFDSRGGAAPEGGYDAPRKIPASDITIIDVEPTKAD